MRTRQARGLALLILAAVAACPRTAPAAQNDGAPNAPRGAETTMLVDFDPFGSTSAAAWAPINVHVACGDKPFSGSVVVEFAQDGTQRARIIAQVTATPGKPVRVPVIAHLNQAIDRMTFRLVSDSGRTVQTLRYASAPTDTEIPLARFANYETVMCTVGPGSTAIMRSAIEKHGLFGTSLLAAPIRPEDLWTSRSAYDASIAIAVDAEAVRSCDPGALAAIREWVAGGGRLLVLSGQSGSAWREWLPPGAPGDVITMEEVRDHAVAREAVAAVVDQLSPANGAVYRTNPGEMTELPAYSEWIDPDEEEAPAEAEPEPEPEPPASPAASIRGRLMNLTDRGRSLGWRTRWQPDDPRDPFALGPLLERRGGGLLAEGPVGFGWVTILTADPRYFFTRPSAESTGRLVTQATRFLLGDLQFELRNDSLSAYSWRSNSAYSAMSNISRWVEVGVLDALARRTGAAVTSSFFIGIMGLMLVIAALTGPVDAVVLRRLRLRHYSWLTAFVWILLATLAAYYTPTLLQRRPTTIVRISSVDAIAPMTAGDGPGEARPLAFQSSYTTVAAAASVAGMFSGGSPSSWWRGCSALDPWDSRALLTPFIQTVQRPANLAALGAVPDAWGGFPLGAAAGQTMTPSTFRLWTVRSLSDEARLESPVRAQVRLLDGVPHVTISRLGDAPPIDAACRIGDQWWSLVFHARDDGAWVAEGVPTVGGGTWSSDPDAETWRGMSAPDSMSSYPGGLARFWPAAARRTAAIDSLTGSGHWALVCLRYHDAPMDVEFSEPAENHRVLLCHLLTPLEHAAEEGTTP